MADGYSDKSISPVVYTPSIDNSPQINLLDEVYRAADAEVALLAIASVSNGKIVPNADWQFRKTPFVYKTYNNTNQITNMNACPGYSNDGRYLLFDAILRKMIIISSDFKSYTYSNTIPTTLAQMSFFRSLPGTNKMLVVGVDGSVNDINISDESLMNWTRLPIAAGAENIVPRAVTFHDSSCNTTLVCGRLTVNGYQQPMIIKFDPFDPNTTQRKILLPSHNVAANVYAMGVCSLGNGVFIASCCTYNTAPLYIYRSVDAGETWTLVYTATGEYQAYSYIPYISKWNGCVALGSETGYLIISKDGGDTWVKKSGALGGRRYGLEVHPDYLSNFPPGYIIAQAAWSPRITTDYGETWDMVVSSLPGSYQATTNILPNGKVISAGYTTNNDGGDFVLAIGEFEFLHENTVEFPTELAFQPTSPAKLSSIGSVSVTIDTTGAMGTIRLYIQHYNDEIAYWGSLANVKDEWTYFGELTSTGSIDVPTFECRAGEKVRFKIGFKQTDPTNIKPAPAVSSVSFTWASDVEAPDTPSLLDFVDTSKTSAGYRIDFGDMPVNARHIIMEGKINDSEYLPFSNRAKFEVDNSHMRFRGSIDAVEAQGERNESHVDFRNGLVVGDIVKVKIATEDSVGNRSAFTESEDLVLSGVTYVPVLTTDWTETWNDNVWRETWTQ